MHVGVLTVGDVTADPATGTPPSEHRRIKNTVEMAVSAEEHAFLQHPADGRLDLVMGRGGSGPVHPWFGEDIR